jgi:8-oxo-dGTP pyrophosphatase MutT (NUDIX family)
MRSTPFAPKSKPKERATETEDLAAAPATPQFDVDRLRSLLLPVLRQNLGCARELSSDARTLTAASVLVPLVARESGVSVLFTQRTAHLKDHPGQISFPGGRVEEEDASPAATALREAHEEIGLASTAIEVLGCLPEHATSTGFLVTPVVGIVTPPFELSLHADEVAQAFEVPLAFLMNAANHEPHSWTRDGVVRHAIALRYDEHFIWGATAAIVMTLFHTLSHAIAGH